MEDKHESANPQGERSARRTDATGSVVAYLDRDWTFPLHHTDPDKIVIGGGYMLSLTHQAK